MLGQQNVGPDLYLNYGWLIEDKMLIDNRSLHFDI